MKLRVPRRLLATLTAEEITVILAACDRALSLGLRHCDFVSRREVTIVPRSGNANGARTKTQSPTTLPVSAPLVRLYSDYMHSEYGSLDSDYVFVNLWSAPIGRPLRYDSVAKLVARLRKRTGHRAHVAPQPSDRVDPRRCCERGRVEDVDPPVGDHHE